MNINDIPYEDRIYAYVVEGVTDEDKLKKAGCKYVIELVESLFKPISSILSK